MSNSLKSYAKVNLGLSLYGKRKDGFHELETIMHEISLCDEIEVELNDNDKDKVIVLDHSELESKDNIIFKALVLLREEYPPLPFFNVKVKKNIPMGGGLGGGSSNGIAVLMFAYGYCKNVSIEKIETIASELGSDTNFFIQGGTSICRGRGEDIVCLPHRKIYFNLIFPNIHCSTVKVFKACSSIDYSKKNIHESWKSSDLVPINDLERPCSVAYPNIKSLIEEVRKVLPNVYMSGSGSTLYTLHENEDGRDGAFKCLHAVKNSLSVLKAESHCR